MKGKELPLLLRVMSAVFRPISGRKTVLIVSLGGLLVGYLIDSYRGEISFFSSYAGIVTALGLILTIKHNYLSNISSVRSLVSSNYEEAQLSPGIEEVEKNEDFVDRLTYRAKDEGLGLLLIILSTLIGSLGKHVPLLPV